MARIKPLVYVSISQDELTKLLKDKPKCKYCGKAIWYENIKVSYKNDGTIHSGIGGTTYKTKKIINDVVYPICVCQPCLEKQYPDFTNRNKSRIFNTFNKYVSYAFDIPQNVIDEKNKISAPTLNNFIKKYDEAEGKQKFDEYREKQSYSNTFEYKHKKYGWTKEQFDEFNKSRAVTYENLIKKHGKKTGEKIWNHYLKQQSYTGTTEYLVETYGEKHAQIVNLCKGHSLNGFIQKYGEEKGKTVYYNYIQKLKNNKSYSKMSKCFFDELIDKLRYNNILYDVEYGDFKHIVTTKNGQTYFYDFYISDLNLIIEFNDDYWHCNPILYDKTYVHPHYDMTAEEIWKNDNIRKTDIINNFGCQYITIWESDIKKDRQQAISNLIEQIKKRIDYVS